MLFWLLGGLAVVTLFVWKTIYSAEQYDKQRSKTPRKASTD